MYVYEDDPIRKELKRWIMSAVTCKLELYCWLICIYKAHTDTTRELGTQNMTSKSRRSWELSMKLTNIIMLLPQHSVPPSQNLFTNKFCKENTLFVFSLVSEHIMPLNKSLSPHTCSRNLVLKIIERKTSCEKEPSLHTFLLISLLLSRELFI